ncbi:chromate efflux transporter [Actibacterium ureilyticum]|uniref:chromate efflux transporter n=1 Tax=Actibacterium ureilyticum TaxID=1590614 RepID=UPI000BAB242E|nr:chromate efflux transporter [Actibacterium ureilyticum]
MGAPDWGQMTRIFGRIGILSFGGPAAQIAVMHRELVEDRPWLTEDQYLRALSFCMLLPGPEAMQLATYAGWRLRGVPGGVLAGALFVLPGALVMLALAALYATYGALPLFQALFLGIKATVVIIVIEALLKVARRALHGPDRWAIAGLSFVGIFALGVPFPLLIGLAALYGYLTTAPGSTATAPAPAAKPRLMRTVLIWGALWLAPVAALTILAPGILPQLALFFSKLAVVTFGGAYAVLAYMTQEVVTIRGWLSTPEMMDALGLAETTPGPLILVTEFVGFLAGFKAGGLWLGTLAALVTLWVTFMPCFLWIFAGAPFIDRLATLPRLSGALNCVTAAVVGVILNLSIWFALHVFFTQVTTWRAGPLRLALPDPQTIEPLTLALAAVAAGLLLWRRWPLLPVLALMAVAGLLGGVLS